MSADAWCPPCVGPEEEPHARALRYLRLARVPGTDVLMGAYTRALCFTLEVPVLARSVLGRTAGQVLAIIVAVHRTHPWSMAQWALYMTGGGSGSDGSAMRVPHPKLCISLWPLVQYFWPETRALMTQGDVQAVESVLYGMRFEHDLESIERRMDSCEQGPWNEGERLRRILVSPFRGRRGLTTPHRAVKCGTHVVVRQFRTMHMMRADALERHLTMEANAIADFSASVPLAFGTHHRLCYFLVETSSMMLRQTIKYLLIGDYTHANANILVLPRTTASCYCVARNDAWVLLQYASLSEIVPTQSRTLVFPRALRAYLEGTCTGLDARTPGVYGAQQSLLLLVKWIYEVGQKNLTNTWMEGPPSAWIWDNKRADEAFLSPANDPDLVVLMYSSLFSIIESVYPAMADFRADLKRAMRHTPPMDDYLARRVNMFACIESMVFLSGRHVVRRDIVSWLESLFFEPFANIRAMDGEHTERNREEMRTEMPLLHRVAKQLVAISQRIPPDAMLKVFPLPEHPSDELRRQQAQWAIEWVPLMVEDEYTPGAMANLVGSYYLAIMSSKLNYNEKANLLYGMRLAPRSIQHPTFVFTPVVAGVEPEEEPVDLDREWLIDSLLEQDAMEVVENDGRTSAEQAEARFQDMEAREAAEAARADAEAEARLMEELSNFNLQTIMLKGKRKKPKSTYTTLPRDFGYAMSESVGMDLLADDLLDGGGDLDDSYGSTSSSSAFSDDYSSSSTYGSDDEAAARNNPSLYDEARGKKRLRETPPRAQAGVIVPIAARKTKRRRKSDGVIGVGGSSGSGSGSGSGLFDTVHQWNEATIMTRRVHASRTPDSEGVGAVFPYNFCAIKVPLNVRRMQFAIFTAVQNAVLGDLGPVENTGYPSEVVDLQNFDTYTLFVNHIGLDRERELQADAHPDWFFTSALVHEMRTTLVRNNIIAPFHSPLFHFHLHKNGGRPRRLDTIETDDADEAAPSDRSGKAPLPVRMFLDSETLLIPAPIDRLVHKMARSGAARYFTSLVLDMPPAVMTGCVPGTAHSELASLAPVDQQPEHIDSIVMPPPAHGRAVDARTAAWV